MADRALEDTRTPLEEAASTTQMVFPKEIAAALIKLQGAVKAMEKTAENDHFKNTYSPLDQVMDTALPLLTQNGLGWSQWPIMIAGKPHLHSVLMHESGSTVQSDIELLLIKRDPQGLGSAITYTRRQTTMAVLGLSAKDEDDDGNKASNHLPAPTKEQIEQITALCLDMKYPKDEVAKRLQTIKTEDHATLAINKLQQVVSQRARELDAIETAKSVEVLSDLPEDQPPPTSMKGIVKRLKNLGLKDDTTVRELVRSITGKPFLKNCKAEDLEKLSGALDQIESGKTNLPGDWYAPSDESRIVDEPTA